MTQPLIVVAGSDRSFTDARREVERAGHTVVESWRPEPGVVSAGPVVDAADAAAALLAAVAGAGVIVHARSPADVTERLVEDLRRFGPVDYRTGSASAGLELTHDERALLDLLANGRSLGAAAAELHLSRRTADRRLASARVKLGVATTAEAVVAHVSSGK